MVDPSMSGMHDIQLFQYCGDPEQGMEDIVEYRRGGFHPIVLDDVLPMSGTCTEEYRLTHRPRYHIRHKLGFGAFGTVWLARDIEQQRWVAVKVCRGTETPQKSNELLVHEYMQQLRRGRIPHADQDDQDACDSILEVYDIFVIKGPNGYHECLVTEVVMPMMDFFPDPRKAAQQVISGFAFLHKQGLAHGDPTVANIGVAIPDMEQVTGRDLANCLQDCPIIPVLRLDPNSLTNRESRPAYLITNLSITQLLSDKGLLPTKQDFRIKIMDFGRAFWTDQHTPNLPGCCPRDYQPPEVRIHRLSGGKVGTVWSMEADIWAVACIVSHLHGQYLVSSTFNSPEKQLFQCCELGGPSPDEWLQYWDPEKLRETYKKLPYEQPLPATFNPEDTWKSPDYSWSQATDRDGLVDLLRMMVRTNPQERSPLCQLQGHRYFAPAPCSSPSQGSSASPDSPPPLASSGSPDSPPSPDNSPPRPTTPVHATDTGVLPVKEGPTVMMSMEGANTLGR